LVNFYILILNNIREFNEQKYTVGEGNISFISTDVAVLKVKAENVNVSLQIIWTNYTSKLQ